MNNLLILNEGFSNRPEFFTNKFTKVKSIDLKRSEFVDVELDYFITNELKEMSYANIFLPASIGSVLTDFLGLRLALHIRTTPGTNQCSNIYIYSSNLFVEIANENNLHQILFTKGVKLIDFSAESLLSYIDSKPIIETNEQLKRELNKLHIEIPSSYYDSHSVANIWGMFRLCEAAGIDIESLDIEIQKNKLSHIYFKWLVAINDMKELRTEETKDKEKEYRIKLKGPKIVGKIKLTKK